MTTTQHAGDRLIVYLDGEIDHFSAQMLRTEMEEQIKQTNPKTLHLDFKNVTFMDSSGVGMIIGRYKTMEARGGHVTAGGFKPQVEKLFRMAGLHRIIQTVITQEGA